MQTISSILKIERGIGTWVTDTGAADYAPSFPLGVLATLSIDLRGPLKSEAFAPSLPAYPIQELQGLSLLMVMDLDYDQETPPRFIRTSGITLSEDEQGHLLCTVPLPDTNTEAMREALSTAETRAFQCELIGRNAEGQDAFAVQFSLTVRNRVLLGEATEAPDTDSPEWLPTVTAIVQEVVAQNAGSLKGEKGESAYSTWLSQGNTGTEEDFLASLKGESQKGDKGDPGSLAMGTVSTLSPGEKATASIQEGLLHLGIPQGEKGKDGTALCYAFSPESAPDSSAWHQHCQKTDLYWRISEDAGATWSHAMPLSQAPVSPIARFSPVAQDTDAQWKTPEDMGDYAQLHDGAAYFRVKMKGYPWTEPRLISATSGMESMTQEQIQEAEDVLKATTIRASFSSDNVSWHASIQEGDLYLRFFSTTGTVLAIWDLSDFGPDHSLQGLQAASQGAPWHESPREGDRFMKISLDGGETWFSKCFQVEGAPGKASSLSIGRVETLPAGSQATASITGEPPDQVLNLGIPKGEDGTGSSSSYTLPPATPDTLGGVKVGRGLSITEDGTLSATGASGTSQAEWGGIGGTLSDQSDLKEALDAKADSSALTHYAPKADSLAGYGITDAYTKDETDAKVSAVYRYKGSAATYAELPTEGNTVGDVWNVAAEDEAHGIKAGDNVAWTGSAWDALSGAVDLTPFATKAEAGTDHNHDDKYLSLENGGTVLNDVQVGTTPSNAWIKLTRSGGIAGGYDCNAYGSNCLAIGYKVTCNAHRVWAFGQEITIPYGAERCLLVGFGHTLKETNENQSFFGRYADTDNDALLVVGNGTSGSTSNAFEARANGDAYVQGNVLEGGVLLSDKYAAKSHTHAMGDITGLPASGGTAGQVLTKTETGSEWADAPSGGTSGEASTDAGAVRVVKNYADYLDVSSLASEQAIHHSATFIPAADVTGDTIEIRKAISGEVTDDTLRKGRIYVQINEGGTGSGATATREVTTSTYVVEKVRIVNSSTGGTYGNWVIISGREGTPYLYPDSYEKAYGGQHGFTFTDRQALEDTSLNGGWPTVDLDAQTLLDAYKAYLEQDGTYIGVTPWYAADAKTSGEVLKRVNGVWRKGNVAYNSSTGETSESFDEETAYEIVPLFKDSTGSYQDTITPYSSETAIERNTRPGNPIIDCLDITPDPLRLAIQALEGAALEVSPGKAYSATLTDNATLSATLGEYGYRQEAYLDVNPGAFTLTPGSGITFAQALTASKVNHCRIVWHGTSARLLVDDVTDAAPSGGGSEDPGGDTPADGWPTKIVISGAASTQGSDVSAFNGDYVRTGETLTILGETVPIWSNGSKYIYGMSSSMGSDLNEPAIALQDSTGENDAYMSYYYRMKSGSSWERADAANAIGFTATITEEGGGSESGGSSDAFPTTFTVTACSGNEAAKGEYTRTGEKTTVGGKDYPVYSYTQPVLATAFYIYVCQYRQGVSGAFWSLKDGSYSASDEGYSGLGSVAVNPSTGLPMAENWSASGKQATVTWA